MSKNLAAAFVLRTTDPLRELLAQAGAADIADDARDESGLVYCTWAGMTCQGYADDGLLLIFFTQTAFLEMLPADDVAAAFAAACERLRPDAAVLVTHPDQAEVEALRGLRGMLVEADIERVAALRPGLLYVSEKLDDDQHGTWFANDRDEVPVPHGYLIFAGRGEKRWW
jgi:hypothetical protein